VIRRGTHIDALILLAIGSILGYAVATEERSRTVAAAPTAGGSGPGAAVTGAPPGCPEGIGRETLLALAERNDAAASKASLDDKKPNILVIFGDDIGQTNISAYSMGLMGYRTPNIDRIAKEGMIFTDYYAEQSCTAGRSSFITGQCTFRTGLSKVGIPAAPIGLRKEDPTIAELLKPHGYATGQFGKNHVGDKNEFLPTVHGFDEFL
jgi:arylsulfatase